MYSFGESIYFNNRNLHIIDYNLPLNYQNIRKIGLVAFRQKYNELT